MKFNTTKQIGVGLLFTLGCPMLPRNKWESRRCPCQANDRSVIAEVLFGKPSGNHFRNVLRQILLLLLSVTSETFCRGL